MTAHTESLEKEGISWGLADQGSLPEFRDLHLDRFIVTHYFIVWFVRGCRRIENTIYWKTNLKHVLFII